MVAGDDDESQSEWLRLLLLMSGAEMTLTVLAFAFRLFLPIMAFTNSRQVGSSLRLDLLLLLLLPLLQFMLLSDFEPSS